MSANIEVDDHEILAALTRIQERTDNLRPVLLEIGEVLTASTKHRFATITAPDGEMWQANSDVTLLNKANGRPLTGETGLLMSTIDYQASDHAVEIGSPRDYAAMQQFGGTKAEFPHLWGDIPAREFLGLSEADKVEILDLAEDYLL